MNTKLKNIARQTAIPIISAAIGLLVGNYFTAKHVTETARMCSGALLQCQILGLTALRDGRIDDATRVFEYVAEREAQLTESSFFLFGQPSAHFVWLTNSSPDRNHSNAKALFAARTYASTYPNTDLRLNPQSK